MSEGGDNDSTATSVIETTNQPLIKPKSHLNNVQLDENNFLLWKYQVEIAKNGYWLEGFIKGIIAIPHVMTADKESKMISNQDYVRYKRQDSLLSACLLSSISVNLLHQIVGCGSSYEIWKTVEHIFNSQSAACIMHYKRELQNLRKENMSWGSTWPRLNHSVIFWKLQVIKSLKLSKSWP